MSAGQPMTQASQPAGRQNTYAGAVPTLELQPGPPVIAGSGLGELESYPRKLPPESASRETATPLTKLDVHRLADLQRCGLEVERRGAAWVITGKRCRIWVANMRTLSAEDFDLEPRPRPTVFQRNRAHHE